MLKIITDDKGIKVWRDDEKGFPRYSISISKKNEDNTYSNLYQSVRFKKGVELSNGETIIIKNAFPSFNMTSDGKKYPYWVITEFTKVGGDDFMAVTGVDEVIDWD